MRVARVGAAGLALAAAGFLACAAHQAPPPAADSQRRGFRVPHGCRGAEIAVRWPDRIRRLDTLIPPKKPAAEGPVAETEEPGPQPTREEIAAAVKNGIEGVIPEIKCRPVDQYYESLVCAEEDLCLTSIDAARSYAQRIRAVVTSAVEVSPRDCACRIYGN